MSGEPDNTSFTPSANTNDAPATTTYHTTTTVAAAAAPIIADANMIQVTVRGITGEAVVRIIPQQTILQLKQSIISFFPQLNHGAKLISPEGVEMLDFNTFQSYYVPQGSIITVAEPQFVAVQNVPYVVNHVGMMNSSSMPTVIAVPVQALNVVIPNHQKGKLKCLWITWCVLILVMLGFNIGAITAANRGCVTAKYRSSASFTTKVEFGYAKLVTPSGTLKISTAPSTIKSAAAYYVAGIVIAIVMLLSALLLLLAIMTDKIKTRVIVVHYLVLGLCISAYVLSSSASGNYGSAVIELYTNSLNTTVNLDYGGILSQMTIVLLVVMLITSCVSCCNGRDCAPNYE